MHTRLLSQTTTLPTLLLTITLTLPQTNASPLYTLHTRQTQPLPACFLPGSATLPADVLSAIAPFQDTISCSTSVTTIGTVPDVSLDGISFSSIDFSASTLSPLAFALSEFATADPLADTELAEFERNLELYIATEAGLRSEGGSLAIKVPKFFLAFQVARIKTAQGIEITNPGQTVEHLLGKVTKNAASEEQGLLDQVTALAGELA